MSFKDILVHVDSTAASRVRLRCALSLTRRFDARLSGLHVIPEPDVPPYFKPSAIERIAKIYAENARAAADKAEALFRERPRMHQPPRHGSASPAIWRRQSRNGPASPTS